MMDYEQHLLCKLAEEASEIAQAAMKCQQFGFNDVNPRVTGGVSNKELLHKELHDILGVVSLLNATAGLNFVPDDNKVLDKEKKIEHWRERSIVLNKVKECDHEFIYVEGTQSALECRKCFEIKQEGKV